MTDSSSAPLAKPEARPTTPPALKDFHTRFLYPFSLNRDRLAQAAEALQQDRLRHRDGKGPPLWKCDDPPSLYREELLDRIVNYLFHTAPPNGCVYLQAGDQAASWFRHTSVRLHDGQTFEVHLAPGPGVELFLSPPGVGVLSLTLTAGVAEPTAGLAQLFNFILSRLARANQFPLCHRHPRDDSALWERIPLEKRQGIPEPPAEAAPLEERLGAPGGKFDLGELVHRLLLPLKTYGLPQEDEVRNLLVYTVARFGPGVKFDQGPDYHWQAPLASELAREERPRHGERFTGSIQVELKILRERHLAAAGLTGAAHLLADVEGDPFNEQYLRVARDKYFIAFLLAVFQRLALEHVLEDLRTIDAQGDDARSRLTVVRRRLRTPAIDQFHHISRRQGLQQFSDLARAGQTVPAALGEARQNLADLDADYAVLAAQRQDRLAHDMAGNLAAITRVQNIIHLIEYLLAAVYTAHFWHMFAADNHTLKHWADEHLPLGGDWLVSLGVLLGAGLGCLIVFVVERVHRRHSADH